MHAPSTSVPSRILVHDALHHDVIPIAARASILQSSMTAPWTTCIVERQQLPPTEATDVYMQAHLLSIQLTPPPVLAWQGDGRPQAVPVQPFDVFFSPAQVVHTCRWQHATEVLNVALPPAFLRQFALETFDQDDVEVVPHRAGPDIPTRHLGLALLADIEAGYPAGPLFGESLIIALATHVLHQYTAAPPARSYRRGRLSSADLRHVRTYIRTNLSAPLTLTDLAHVLHLSPYHFARAFKATTGVTPHHYVIRCRVDEAKRLLETTNLSVDTIAQVVGFAHRSHLYRHIRHLLNSTPRELRRR